MTISAERERGAPTASWRSLPLKAAATMDCDAVLEELGSTPEGLSTDEAGAPPGGGRSQRAAQPWRAAARRARAPVQEPAADPADRHGLGVRLRRRDARTRSSSCRSSASASGWASSTSTAPSAPSRSCTPSSGTPRSRCANGKPGPRRRDHAGPGRRGRARASAMWCRPICGCCGQMASSATSRC